MVDTAHSSDRLGMNEFTIFIFILCLLCVFSGGHSVASMVVSSFGLFV